MRTAAFLFLAFFAATAPAQQTAPATPAPPIFTLQEVMIPVRDGVHLQTAIRTPVAVGEPLPTLFRRTPVGVPEQAPAQMPASVKDRVHDGYLLCIQIL